MNKYILFIICDGTEFKCESKYSAKQIVDCVGRCRELGENTFIEVDEGFYLDPSKVSLIKDITEDYARYLKDKVGVRKS
ncbi:hypothetical protein GNF80_16765 [Clostridium perfringens]|nr:hypothetical protein [Clostridium perfringens]